MTSNRRYILFILKLYKIIFKAQETLQLIKLYLTSISKALNLTKYLTFKIKTNEEKNDIICTKYIPLSIYMPSRSNIDYFCKSTQL